MRLDVEGVWIEAKETTFNLDLGVEIAARKWLFGGAGCFFFLLFFRHES